MKPKKNSIESWLGDSISDTFYKSLIGEILSKESISDSIIQQIKPPPIGKLIWGEKETLSHHTKVSPMGDLITEIFYEIPVVFENENPGPIKISKIIAALENALDKSYSNFINIEKCSIRLNDNKFYIKVAAIFHDHGPAKREK